MASILVVDDDPLILSMLAGIIEDKGHQVTTAENGTRALAAVAAGPVDLVVTDIFMPETEGLETIATIRRRRGSTKILAISGHRCAEYLAMAKSLGADATLPKPFSADVLLDAIDRLL
jgi:CheY-like chemotaxis protein